MTVTDGVPGRFVGVVDRELAAIGLGTNRSRIALGVTTGRLRLKFEIHGTAINPMPSAIRVTPATSNLRARALLSCSAKNDFNLLVRCQQ